jgi:ketosteroid isomerase-like protein
MSLTARVESFNMFNNIQIWKRYQFLLSVALGCALTLSGLAIHARSATVEVDRAYLQSIWDGWAGLDATKQARFYAPGPRVYFDEAPLKYDSWDQYRTGVSKLLTEIKSAKFTVNDDAEIHRSENLIWATATVAQDVVLKDGKQDATTLRWTVVFDKFDGKWLIVHEHVSRPME